MLTEYEPVKIGSILINSPITNACHHDQFVIESTLNSSARLLITDWFWSLFLIRSSKVFRPHSSAGVGLLTVSEIKTKDATQM